MKRQLILAAIATLLLLMAGGLTAAQEPENLPAAWEVVQGQPPNQAPEQPLVSLPGTDNLVLDQQLRSPEAIDARPTGSLSYQGRLLRAGSPYNGTLSMDFKLYSVDTGGSPWWQETQSVSVSDGVFNVMLGAVQPLNRSAVQFQIQQWLEVVVAGTTLSPRQPLSTVAYAMNLMPGATIVDENASGGYSYSLWLRSVNHPAAFIRSESSTGMVVESAAAESPGVWAQAYGDGNASHGVSARMSGVSGSCPGGTTECGSGLYAAASGDAYGLWAYGQNRSGIITIQGDNTYYGLWVDSLRSPDGSGIWTDGASSFTDYVTFSGGKSGYVVDIALNDGPTALEKGDVVVISGYAEPVVGNIPVMRVRKVGEANSTGVVGVVDVGYEPCRADQELQVGQACGGFQTDVTVIRPGAYLSVVTLGAYEAVKVDASAGPIRPGDLLATSASPGRSGKAAQLTLEGVEFTPAGTVVGKALGSLDSGTGTIPVFVSAR